MVTLGKIAGVFGVKGWIKVFSYTHLRDSILDYSPWLVSVNGKWQEYKVIAGQVHGKGIVAQLEGINTREMAEALKGCEIAIPRDQLRKLKPNEYYWTDLIGLNVINQQGVSYGKVESLFETGSNDVLVVTGEQERLIPWIWERVVMRVDLEAKEIYVDWDADF